jgi:hypothetical protein
MKRRRAAKRSPEIVLTREIWYTKDRFGVSVTCAHNRRGMREIERAFPWLVKAKPGEKWR